MYHNMPCCTSNLSSSCLAIHPSHIALGRRVVHGGAALLIRTRPVPDGAPDRTRGVRRLHDGRGPRQIDQMRLSLELSASLEAQLASVAARLNVTTEELATAFLRDVLLEPSADFDAAATRVVRENRELYRRLA